MPISTEYPYRDASLPVEQRVADLLSRMTLEEKLAQMSIFDPQNRRSGSVAELLADPEIERQWSYGVGAVGRPGVNRGPRETAEWTNALQRYVREQTRWGIPVLCIDEALHGAMAWGCTSFPQAIGLASSWDPELVREVFAVAAKEMRVRGEHHALTPVLDLAREPRWGRTEETYGEDPYLGSRMGVAAVQGFQGRGPAIDQDHVMATAKHFAVHGQPEGGRNCGPTNYAEREIRENFLKAFQAVVEAGIASVMASYNEINGIPAHINRWLLRDILRREWGFQGLLVSDGGGVSMLESVYHVATSPAEAARKALAAGIDFEYDLCFPTLLEQVRSGQVAEALVDQAVGRVLRAKFLLGLFENPYVDPEEAERVTNCEAYRALALKAAYKSLVLLKNEGVLPLDAGVIKTLAVIGPNAAGLHLGGYSNQPGHSVTVLEGLRQKAGGRFEVLYAEGCKITGNDFGGADWKRWWEDSVLPPDPEEDARLIAEATAVARRADAVVLVLGENESVCREAWSQDHLGDRDSLDLPGRQEELARAILETGVPTVVLLLNGRPLSINHLAGHAPAIFEGWYLGEEGGTAFADVLFGDVNPGGRLPITFPRSVGQLPAYYNRKPFSGRRYLFSEKGPLYPFGYGLSYTTFAYADLKVEPAQIGPAGKARVSVTVSNTGDRAGDEVVQLYLHDVASEQVSRPLKELKGFQRITLQPGERRTVEFTVGPEELSFLNETMAWTVEPGEFEVLVGPNSADLQKVMLEVKG